MAFTTEFVMGAGGAVEVEEIPVSGEGDGSGTVYPLATVNAGSGAWVWVDGERAGQAPSTLNVGAKEYASPSGESRAGGGGYFTGSVVITYTIRGLGTRNSFTGTVYVTRL